MTKSKRELTLDNGLIMALDMNALIAFEDITGKDALETLDGFAKGETKMRDMRALFHVCFLKHQPEMTLEEAGALFFEYQDKLMETAVLSLGGAEPTTTGTEAATPPKATGAIKKK